MKFIEISNTETQIFKKKTVKITGVKLENKI